MLKKEIIVISLGKIEALHIEIVISIILFQTFKDSFQFLSSSVDGLVKNLSKDDFKYFNHRFDNNVLDLVKQK